ADPARRWDRPSPETEQRRAFMGGVNSRSSSGTSTQGTRHGRKPGTQFDFAGATISAAPIPNMKDGVSVIFFSDVGGPRFRVVTGTLGPKNRDYKKGSTLPGVSEMSPHVWKE